MDKRKGYDFRKTLTSVVGLGVLLLILILVNVLLSFVPVRLDATEEKLYSLSQGTKNILAGLRQPVDIKFFYSGSAVDYNNPLKLYGQRVEDFLREYERAAGGKIKVETIDPRPDSDEEDWAVRYGLKPLSAREDEKIFCGLVFLCQDRQTSLEFLDPGREELLEYDVTRSIQRVESGKKGVVGIVSSLPVFGMAQRPPAMGAPPEHTPPWFFVEELRKTYEVREIPYSATVIDSDVDLLMVIHPKDLPPALEYALDQFVMGGGNLLVFVDPFCVWESQNSRQPMGSGPSSLDRLFSAWGIAVDKNQMVVDFGLATPIRTGENQKEDSPVVLSFGPGNFNHEDVTTSRLEKMLLAVAGAVKQLPEAKVAFEPLIVSDRDAALVAATRLRDDPAALRKGLTPAGAPLDLAVRLSGTFKSAFPDGSPPPPEGSPDAAAVGAEKAPHLSVGRAKANIIVVADADLLADMFCVQRGRVFGMNIGKTFNDNVNFLSNLCEILTGGQDLIGIRTRGTFERPFTKVEALERAAQVRWLDKENELKERIDATNRRLRELQEQKSESQKLIPSPAQEAEIDKFREEKRRINQELKQVRKNLRADIEALGMLLKGLNIFLMPALVAAFGLGYAWYRQKRKRNR